MRVTGDCFFAARDVERLTAAFLRGAALVALRFEALFDLLAALLFVLPREAARFDAVDDFRAFPPDDFDAVAMIFSSWKVQAGNAQDSRTEQAAKFAASQNQHPIAECNRLVLQFLPPVRRLEAIETTMSDVNSGLPDRHRGTSSRAKA